MPTLRKRKRSDKRTVWDIRYYADGKRQTFTIGETDTRTAQKIYHEFCARLAQGKLDGNIVIPRGKVARDERTLSGLAKHAASFAAVNKKPATAEREQNVFDRLLALMGDIPVSALTHQRVEEYKAIRLQEVSPATLNIEIRILNTAINQAIETEWIETDFRKKAFRQIRIPESDSKTSLSGAQITRLLSTKDMEFRRYLIFLLCTGCRRSEALEITWNDIDLDDGVVFVRGSVGKMGKRRQIPINDQLLEILEK
ncbi:tyrosine-type recombinase/integrase, partial [bacterium]|nr:tyrosine-type recombinase/integrase [bacterium]